MKMLYITTGARSKFGSFEKSSIFAAKQANVEFHIASNEKGIDQGVKDAECKELGIYHHNIQIERSPLALKQNYRAYKELIALITECDIDVIHCNTPMGGVLGRFAARACKVSTVIYQAHGFHFWKGAPRKNWICYYPVEKVLASMTDILVTINQDDYFLAKSKLNAKNILYIPGVGIDLKRFQKMEAESNLRESIGCGENEVLLLSVGELNENKNHEVVIRALGKLSDPHFHYAIAGAGGLDSKLEGLAADCGISDRFHLLGFRTDVHNWYQCADIFVFPSKREGLPSSIMEAMASGLPCIVSKIRGNTDLITDREGGFMAEPLDAEAFARSISELAGNRELRENMGKTNLSNVQRYDFDRIVSTMSEMYMHCQSM